METINVSNIEKKIRSFVIKEHMERNGIKYAVCFSCGNASQQLKKAGVKLLDISPTGDLTANRWFTMDEIRAFFPNVFDATSGHIPIDLINEIARRIKKEIHPIDKQYIVETGSGETLLVLSIAFPEIKFKPEYNTNKATAFNKESPLNDLIAAISKTQKPTAAS